jgi:hypothetical protein
MSEITTFTDFTTVWMASLEMPVEEYNLKSLCLYNDRVILNADNKICRVFIDKLHEDFKISKKLLNGTFISIDDVIADKERSYFYSKIEVIDELIGKENAGRALELFIEEEAKRTGNTVEKVRKDWQLMYEWSKYFYYSTLSILSNLELYSRINETIPCSITGFAESTNTILNSYLKHQSDKSESFKVESSIADKVEYVIPSLKQLNWNELFEIRQDGRAKAFRHWINENKEEIDSNGLQNLIYKEFWNVLTELKPNTSANVIKATLGNIPLPIPVNPISVATGIQDIYKARAFNKKYSWLLFIHDLQDRK